MPRGIKVQGMTMWDRFELESALENLKEQQGARHGNPIEAHYGINGEQ